MEQHAEAGPLSVILTTCPDMESARSIAAELLRNRLVACVSIVPGVVSIFEWQETLEESSEQLLFIKTRSSQVDAVFDKVAELHPYECPELVALPVESTSNSYSAWIHQMTK